MKPKGKNKQGFSEQFHNLNDSDEIPEYLMKELQDMIQRSALNMSKQASLVNPFGKRMTVRDFFISQIFAGENPSPIDSAKIGNYFIHILRNLSATETEAELLKIISFKKESEKLKHRNYYAIFAYGEYILEVGKTPSKCALKKYMIARKEKFTDQPDENDLKGWTRLWKTSPQLRVKPSK
jgi:hypothetical protein